MITERIIEKAKSLGADVAGLAGVDSLKSSPSHRLYERIGMNLEVPWQEANLESRPPEVAWPADAVSAVVIGVVHDPAKPELDWWDGKGTPGNRILMRINKELAAWIEEAFSFKTYKLPYFVEKGGIFLKDAAVMAGLGCVGRNNLVINPQYGPRIRFRALLLTREVEPSRPLDFNPCSGCDEPCRAACPVGAFRATVYAPEELGQSALPGINGTYDRVTCNAKMENDIEEAVRAMALRDEEYRTVRHAISEFEKGSLLKTMAAREPKYCVKYCRKCELTCPVGDNFSQHV